MIIRDGDTHQGSKVLSDGGLVTRAIAESEIEHISASESESFAWTSTFATGTTDIEVLTIKNDHPSKDLIVETIFLGADAIGVWTIGLVSSGTPAGTTVTPLCLNREVIKTAQATAFGNASVTGSVVVDNLFTVYSLASHNQVLPTAGALLITKDVTFGAQFSTSANASITVFGYFADSSEL